MDLYPIFDWLELTWIGTQIRNSLWLFPVIEAVHLLALAMLGGAVLIVDLRMMGVGLKSQATSYITRTARPYLIGSIAVLIATGVPLFLSEAVKCLYNRAFWVKMCALAAGLAFTFAVRNRVALSDTANKLLCKSVAVTSIALWFTVAAAGRWIGFS